jgi:hypothetical protein
MKGMSKPIGAPHETCTRKAMTKPYIQENWRPFQHDGVIYTFDHLAESQIKVIDSSKVERGIVVTFSDHCFTRDPQPNDDLSLRYPFGSRREGYFCPDRYQYSLGLAQHIDQATRGKIWNIRDKDTTNSFAIVPTIDHRGARVLYGIVFNLDPVSGLPVDLHMRVKTAYPCDKKEIGTFGFLDFSHLVKLRMQHKYPKLIYDRRRKKPRVI